MTSDHEGTVTVIAEYQARYGEGDEVAAVLARHVAATRAEPGCLTFIAYRDPADPDHFLLYEQYTGEDAFEAHRHSSHFAAYIEGQVVPRLAQRGFRRYEEVLPDPGLVP
jgi:quinol monooxygenase YgiN